jgi:formyltetrahydrofolate deformylase
MAVLDHAQAETFVAEQPTGATARLLLSSVDRPGITAAVSSFLEHAGANICQAAQYSTDAHGGRLFMRVAFHHAGLEDAGERAAFEHELARTVARFAMSWRVSYVADRKRVALMVSRYDHCLLDLLWRQRRDELPCEMPLVVSNHMDLAEDVEVFGVRYVHIPVTRETKPQAEQRLLDALDGKYDLVVLARYMQVLSGDLLERAGCPIINIHHSFLPAFAGPDPYERARERGVKLIGATAHYVTEDLDAGPIIEQDIVRVTHAETAADLTRIGRDVERTVLARAVKWHLEDRVVVDGNRTVVF